MSEAPAARDDLQRLSRDKLRDLARSRGLRGFGSMRKSELVQALCGSAAGSNHVAEPPPKRSPHAVRVGPPRLRTDSSAPADRLDLEPLDPRWLKAKWVLTPQAMERVVLSMGAEWHRALPVLRIFRIACDESGPRSKSWYQDLPIPGDVVQWFVNVPVPGGTWQLELGYSAGASEFYPLMHSQPTALPQSQGHPHTATLDRSLAKHIDDAKASVDVHLTADLVVSGTTLPGASVTIDDDRVPVSEQGSFLWNAPFPDGRKVIPIHVECADRARQRILLATERNTRFLEPERFEG